MLLQRQLREFVPLSDLILWRCYKSLASSRQKWFPFFHADVASLTILSTSRLQRILYLLNCFIRFPSPYLRYDGVHCFP